MAVRSFFSAHTSQDRFRRSNILDLDVGSLQSWETGNQTGISSYSRWMNSFRSCIYIGHNSAPAPRDAVSRLSETNTSYAEGILQTFCFLRTFRSFLYVCSRAHHRVWVCHVYDSKKEDKKRRMRLSDPQVWRATRKRLPLCLSSLPPFLLESEFGPRWCRIRASGCSVWADGLGTLFHFLLRHWQPFLLSCFPFFLFSHVSGAFLFEGDVPFFVSFVLPDDALRLPEPGFYLLASFAPQGSHKVEVSKVTVSFAFTVERFQCLYFPLRPLFPPSLHLFYCFRNSFT